MSRVVERALKAVPESVFTFKDANTLEVMNAFIFWTNFRGEANKFGNTARTFNLAINEELAEVLKRDGWRVREASFDDEILYFVNIKVNMNSAYPPLISLFTEFRGRRSKRALDIDSISELDRIDIQAADCIINAYVSDRFPGKVTGYLKKLNVIQEPEIDFGGKYDDWLEEEDNDEENNPYEGE